MSISDAASAVAVPNLFLLSPEMARDERSRTVRAFLDDAEKRKPTLSQDPLDLSVIAQRASEAVKLGKHITHEQIVESRARLAEAERNNKVLLLELNTNQGRITIDHTGISASSETLLATVRNALAARHESGELPEPADKSHYLNQLIAVAESLYGRDAETSKLPEAELRLSDARGAVTMILDGSITATGGMSVVIANLLQPGNALSPQPSDRLGGIVAKRTAVLQSLLSMSK